MHIKQEKLLELVKNNKLNHISLREIGLILSKELKENKAVLPQNVKFHLEKLRNNGLIIWNTDKKTFLINDFKNLQSSDIFPIPVLGYANCGEALEFADENSEKRLMLSKNMILNKNPKNLFIVKAVGISMNRSKINGKGIEDGDYVLIDRSLISPENGNIVLSVISGCANIKKYTKYSDYIKLESESTQPLDPIYIHNDDDYMINGIVINVIKTQ